MTFYDVWVSVKNGSVAKRPIDSDFVYIKFENNKIIKKFDSNPVWTAKNLNDEDVKVFDSLWDKFKEKIISSPEYQKAIWEEKF